MACRSRQPISARQGSKADDRAQAAQQHQRGQLGASDRESVALMKEIYAPLHSLEIPFVVTNVESAELIK